jgi:hypothetical protein
VLEKAVAQDFRAEPVITFAPEGLIYEIATRLSVVTPRAEAQEAFKVILPT